MKAALALVALATASAGCRGRAQATTRDEARRDDKQRDGQGAEPWSCGAVHDAAPLRRRLGARGKLTLGAIADTHAATAETIATVERLARRMREAQVDAVAVLGDLGRTQDEVTRVLAALRGAKAPLLALAGERESENAFHAGVNQAQKDGIDVIDLVGKRLMVADDIDIVSLPGYPFTDRGCRYRARDFDGVRALMRGRDRARALVVLGHMPPRGEGRGALDATWGDTNVGDREVARLVDELAPRVALFAHVDEAGGHVQKTATGVMVNAGSAEAGDGARATIVRLVDGKSSVEMLQ